MALKEYKSGTAFTGVIGRHSATVDVSGDLIKDDEHALKMALARQ